MFVTDDAPVPATSRAGKMVVVAVYSLTTALLLGLHFLVLSGLPEPPVLAPRRGLTRSWRRQRFMQRCHTRSARLMELLADY